MVISSGKQHVRERASLMIELLVAMSILVGVMMPLAWSLASERRLARALYQRAVAMEIVDGELEVLMAGEWKTYGAGQHLYAVNNVSRTNLPQGEFWLTVQTNNVKLEWQPTVKHHGGAVARGGRIQ